MEGEREEAGDHGGEGGASGGGGKKLTLDLILVLGNTLLVLGALGMLVYTKLLYEKAPIVEEEELKKKEEEVKKPATPEDRVIVAFDPLVINIAMSAGKAHYVTVTFSVECRDDEAAGLVKAKKALLVDKFISALGKRQLAELNTIQGKLLVKNEILREFNKIVTPAGVTDLFFANFVLQ